MPDGCVALRCVGNAAESVVESKLLQPVEATAASQPMGGGSGSRWEWPVPWRGESHSSGSGSPKVARLGIPRRLECTSGHGDPGAGHPRRKRHRRIARVMTVSPHVRAVDESNLAVACAFLEQHADTSMFLLGNLDVNGPRIGPALNSGNFKMIENGSRVCAVFCLTRRTAILAEAGGRAEFAQTIVDACRQESIPIGGVMGEWRLAEAIWSILKSAPGFREVFASKEILQALDLSHVTRPNPHSHVRHLAADDFEQWDALERGILRGGRNTVARDAGRTRETVSPQRRVAALVGLFRR